MGTSRCQNRAVHRWGAAFNSRHVGAVLLVLLLWGLPGCRQADEAAVTPASAAGQSTVVALAPVTQPAATQAAEPTPTAAGLMSESNAVGEAVPYFLTVSSAGVAQNREAPAGFQVLVVTATLANESGPRLTVSADSLALVAPDGTRYAPEADEPAQPALVGYELPPGERVVGFASFLVPAGAAGLQLQWCPGVSHPCQDPYTAPAE